MKEKKSHRKILGRIVAVIGCVALLAVLVPLPFIKGRADTLDGITVTISGQGHDEATRAYNWKVDVNPTSTAFSKIVLKCEQPTEGRALAGQGNKQQVVHRLLSPISELSEADRKTEAEEAVRNSILQNTNLSGATVEVNITNNRTASSPTSDVMDITITPSADQTISGAFSFTFKTYSTWKRDYASNNSYSVRNKITLTTGSTKADGSTITNEVPSTGTYNLRQTGWGFISIEIDSYDPIDNTVTWIMEVNNRKTNVKKLLIDHTAYETGGAEATQKGVLEYVVDSAEIKWDGDSSFSKLADAEGYHPGEGGASENKVYYYDQKREVFVVLVGKPGNTPMKDKCQVKYKTKFVSPKFLTTSNTSPKVETEVYTYVSNLYNNDWGRGEGQTQFVRKRINLPNELMDKEIATDDGVNGEFTLMLNPMSLKLSNTAGNKIQISEQMNAGINIDMDTVKVYKANRKSLAAPAGGYVNAFNIPSMTNDFISKGALDAEATASAILDPATNILTFTVDDATAYILTFNVKATGNADLTSSTSLGGTVFDNDTTYGKNTVDFVPGKITVTVLDEDDSTPISGVNVGLYTENPDISTAMNRSTGALLTMNKGGGPTPIEIKATDALGKAVFGPLTYGTYYTKQLSHRNTHFIDEAAYAVTISKTSGAGTQEIKNEKNPDPPAEPDPVDPNPGDTGGSSGGDSSDSTPDKNIAPGTVIPEGGEMIDYFPPTANTEGPTGPVATPNAVPNATENAAPNNAVAATPSTAPNNAPSATPNTSMNTALNTTTNAVPNNTTSSNPAENTAIADAGANANTDTNAATNTNLGEKPVRNKDWVKNIQPSEATRTRSKIVLVLLAVTMTGLFVGYAAWTFGAPFKRRQKVEPGTK